MRYLALCILLATSAARAQEPPRVELLTIEPGDPLWARFGHTALRVRSTGAQEGGVVFSFGYAPFDHPSFALDYLRGEAQFMVGIRSWEAMLRMYRDSNRTFVRQPLRLSAKRTRRLVHALSAHLLPENRHYTYAQLTDNCATRVRDLIDAATDGALRRTVAGSTGERYRAHTLRAAGDDLLLSFGLDVVGGPHQDRTVSGWQALYLPEALRTAVVRTRVDGQPLVTHEHVVFEREGPPVTAGPRGTGRYAWLLSSALLGLWIVLGGAGRSPRLTGVCLFVYGAWLTGWALFLDLLVALSHVPDFAWNENVLSFLPTDVLLCVVGLRMARGTAPAGEALPHFVWVYAVARTAWTLCLAAVSVTPALPQDNLAFVVAPGLLFGALATARLGPQRGPKQPA